MHNNTLLIFTQAILCKKKLLFRFKVIGTKETIKFLCYTKKYYFKLYVYIVSITNKMFAIMCNILKLSE